MKEVHQKISQFMDDELHPAELESFLVNVKKNPELISKITRYQLMSHSLKSNDFVVANEGFLNRVTQGIKQEPHYLLPKNTIKKVPVSIWGKTSLAVAASVTVVAIMLTQQADINNAVEPQIAQVSIAVEKQALEAPVQVAEKQLDSQHERFKAYLQAHSDDLYTHGSINVHPLARVASYK